MADEHAGPPFAPSEFAARMAAARRLMAARGLDCCLLVAPANTYYLTGFGTGSAASANFLVLPVDGEPFWAMRLTEISNLRLGPVGLVPNEAVPVRDQDDVAAILARSLLDHGLGRGRIGFEGEALAFTVGHHARLAASLPAATLIDASGLVESLRRVKSAAELAYMRRAGAITALAIEAGLDVLRDGVTDSEIAAAAVSAAIRAGSDRMAAMPYVVSGPGSARAHSSWSGRVVARGDIVNLEIASSVARYHVPTFRVLSLGPPSAEAAAMHEASEAGLAAGLRAVGPGMTSHEADLLVREAVRKAGYGAEFVVRAAYGIGIAFPPSWGEPGVASIRPDDPMVLEEGMCFHLVPALYRDGVGAVCCSVPVEVTASGLASLTSLAPRLMQSR